MWIGFRLRVPRSSVRVVFLAPCGWTLVGRRAVARFCSPAWRREHDGISRLLGGQGDSATETSRSTTGGLGGVHVASGGFLLGGSTRGSGCTLSGRPLRCPHSLRLFGESKLDAR